MCDYSLMHVQSRPARVGDKLVIKNFGMGTRGFAAPEDSATAVCVLPGTELAFDEPFKSFGANRSQGKTAIFRQINRLTPNTHHDALETPDGEVTLLTYLLEDQHATVLQLPVTPKNEAEVEDQKRVEVVA